MSYVKSFCSVLILVIFFLTGVYLTRDFYPEWLKYPVDFYMDYLLGRSNEYMRVTYGVSMLVLPLLYLALALKTAWEHEESYVIKGADGNTRISELSIRRSLVSAIRTVPNVIRVFPRIRSERAGLVVMLDTEIELSRFAPNISDQIRRRARSTLEEVLGISRIQTIDVNIEKVHLPAPPLAERIRGALGGKKPAAAQTPAREATKDRRLPEKPGGEKEPAAITAPAAPRTAPVVGKTSPSSTFEGPQRPEGPAKPAQPDGPKV